MDNPEIIWQPSSESKKSSNLSRFIESTNQRYSQSIKTEYQDIWDWSVNNIEKFFNPFVPYKENVVGAQASHQKRGLYCSI